MARVMTETTTSGSSISSTNNGRNGTNSKSGKKRTTKSTSVPPQPSSPLRTVDFSKVALSSLRKYKKAHKVRLRHGINKQELAEAITKHFAQLPPPSDEAGIIESFALAVQNQDREARKNPRSPQK